MKKEIILYVGGFQLPDKNAAALRVMANAKALRILGHQVIFLNALKEASLQTPRWTTYDGFSVFEYQREAQCKYLLGKKEIVKMIKECQATCVIAYNHPAFALNSVRRYCKKNGIRCIADVTEWYIPKGSIFFKVIKGLDSEFRMRYVHPRMDGVIVISQYLYDYYREKVFSIKVPPLVDIDEAKWSAFEKSNHQNVEFIYAGAPTAQKERLDLIVKTVENIDDKYGVHLNVVGITKEQYDNMYNTVYKGQKTTFLGRMDNAETIKLVSRSNWSIILRENNKVVKAGFPTKLVESITCGTPVIINKFSNVKDYLNYDNSIMIDDMNKLTEAIIESMKRETLVKHDFFDYRNFVHVFKELF